MKRKKISEFEYRKVFHWLPKILITNLMNRKKCVFRLLVEYFSILVFEFVDYLKKNMLMRAPTAITVFI